MSTPFGVRPCAILFAWRVSDEPPPEIAETGRYRCIISLQSNNVDEWLAPSGVSKIRLCAPKRKLESILTRADLHQIHDAG